MGLFFRKKLACFYCGASTNRRFDGSFSKFRCRSCDTDNYLDKDGEITDPPVPSRSSPQKQGVRYSRIAYPTPMTPLEERPEFEFCKTCQRNQQLYQSALSSYLPSTSHPEYEQLEADFPAYQKTLEHRYPLTCPRCQPRVEEHLRKREYATRAMLLNKSIQRSKTSRRNGQSLSRYTLGRPLTWMAGTLWAASTAFQAGWHALLLRTDWAAESAAAATPLPQLVQACAADAYHGAALNPACVARLSDYYPIAFSIALLTIWWSPAVSKKLSNPRSRLVGVKQHISTQTILLALRGLSWKFLQTPDPLGLPAASFQAVHGFLLVMSLLNVYIACTVMYTTKPVNPFSNPRPTRQSDQAQSTANRSPQKGQIKPAGLFPISSLANSLPTDDLLQTSRYEYSESEPSECEHGSSSDDNEDQPAAGSNEDVDMMDCTEDEPAPSFLNNNPVSDLRLRQQYPASPALTFLPTHSQSRFGESAQSSVFGTPQRINPSPFAPSAANQSRPNAVWSSNTSQSAFGQASTLSWGAPAPMQSHYFTPSRNPTGFGQSSAPAFSTRAAGFGQQSAQKAPAPARNQVYQIQEPKLRLGNSGTGLEGLLDSAFSISDDKPEKKEEDAGGARRQAAAASATAAQPHQRRTRRKEAGAPGKESGKVDSKGYYSARVVNGVVLVAGLLAVLFGVSGWVWGVAGQSRVVWVMPIGGESGQQQQQQQQQQPVQIDNGAPLEVTTATITTAIAG